LQKKKEMRVTFYDNDLKGKLDELAAELDFSLNQLVNSILSAHFSEKEKQSLQLMENILENNRKSY
jgi:hypothetical protein